MNILHCHKIFVFLNIVFMRVHYYNFRKKCSVRTRKQQMETERKTEFNIHQCQLVLLFLQADLPLMFHIRCIEAHANKNIIIIIFPSSI